jgi:hypothetical protein
LLPKLPNVNMWVTGLKPWGDQPDEFVLLV